MSTFFLSESARPIVLGSIIARWMLARIPVLREGDEATSTLTIATDQGNGITTTAAFHVVDQDHREYHVTAKDGDGKLYLDVHGTVTRRKSP